MTKLFCPRPANAIVLHPGGGQSSKCPLGKGTFPYPGVSLWHQNGSTEPVIASTSDLVELLGFSPIPACVGPVKGRFG